MTRSLRDFLQKEFDKRRRKNPKYSLRALARDLSMDPTALSRILRGTRPISAKAARRLLVALKISPNTRAIILRSLIDPQENGVPGDDQYVALTPYQLEQMDEWIYSALLALIDSHKLNWDSSVIADFFGLSIGKIERVLNRLQDLKLIMRTQRGYRKVFRSFTTLDKGTRALKQIHKGYLERTLYAIDAHDSHSLDVSGITLLISPEKLPEAKRRIKEFRRSLAQYLEAPAESAGPDLYRIGVQLFPLKK